MTMRTTGTKWLAIGATAFVLLSGAWALAEEPPQQLGTDATNLLLAPYVWKCSGTGAAARAEATMPGAYLRARFQGSATVGLVIDGTANDACPAPSMPVVEFSVDQGPYTIVPLTKTGEVYVLPLGGKLDPAAPHAVEVIFRAADLAQKRWTQSTAHLRIAGLELAAGGTLLPCPARSKRAIWFGDSITEGVGVDALFTSWQILGPNNARGSWCPLVSLAMDCEYGQLGTGGQGMVIEKMELPPLPQTWDHYDAQTSRLTEGRLVPEPDYVFCAMGTNDYRPENMPVFVPGYTDWLIAVRKACPNARLFCITPPLGTHAQDVREIVAARRREGDLRVHLIDMGPLEGEFVAGRPTRWAYDGVHPTLYGNARLSTRIVAEVEKVLRDE